MFSMLKYMLHIYVIGIDSEHIILENLPTNTAVAKI